MSIGRTLARGFGYVLLFFSLPEFMGLYVLFSSNSISSFFLQNLSGTIALLTKSTLLVGFLSISVLNYLLVISGLVAIAGAALIILFSDGYTGLSKVGTEVLILSIISLISVYVIFNLILPTALSNFTSSSSASGISSLISTIATPITSKLISLDIVFIAFGAVLIALRFVLQKLKKPAPQKVKKGAAKTREFFLYRFVGVPSGVAVVIVLLLLTTLFSSVGALNLNPYHYTSIPSSSVSSAYQSLKGTPQIFNLSDYYFISSGNMNNTYSGSIKLSPAIEPLSFSLPMSFSVAKVLDPIRFDFGVNLSNFSNIANMVGNSNVSLPNYIRFDVLYNNSGITSCSNVNSANNTLKCSFEPLKTNITKELLNINGTSVNRSILGQIFGFLTLPLGVFSGNLQNYSSNSFIPQFTFVNHVSYNNENCSLFDVNGSYAKTNTSGQVCISDYDGLPAFFYINEVMSLDKQLLEVNINFGLSSRNTNVTLNEINSLPGNSLNNRNTSSGAPTALAYVINAGSSGLGNGTVQVINTATNSIISNITVGNNPTGIAITPNGQYVYVTNYGSNTVSVINTTTNTVTSVINVGTPRDIAITPNGQYVYVTNFNGIVSIINTATNSIITNVTLSTNPSTVTITPNDQYAYVAGDSTVVVLNTATDSTSKVSGTIAAPEGIAITPNGEYVYIADYASNKVDVISTTTNTVFDTINVSNAPRGVAITPNGQYVFVTNHNNNSVSVISTTTNNVVGSAIPVGRGPNEIAITPNGQYAYVTNQFDSTISIINIATDTVIATINIGNGGTNPLGIAIDQ